jgi:hypothetical protein
MHCNIYTAIVATFSYFFINGDFDEMRRIMIVQVNCVQCKIFVHIINYTITQDFWEEGIPKNRGAWKPACRPGQFRARASGLCQ